MRQINKLLLTIFLLTNTISYSQPVPLSNCGNSCYINSLIQAFYNIPELTYYLITEVDRDGYEQDSIIPLYIDLIKKITLRKDYQFDLPIFAKESANLMRSITGQAYGAQEDASEFMVQFINSLKMTYNEQVRLKIDQMFDIGLLQKIACPIPEYLDIKSTTLNIESPTPSEVYLPLPVRYSVYDDVYSNFTTLNECIESYFTTTLDDSYNFADETFYNCNIKKGLTNSSDILIIALQRFQPESYASEGQQQIRINKLQHPIAIPLKLDLNFYSAEYLRDPLARASALDDYKYKLIAAIKHTGDQVGGGHYTAYVLDQEGQWYLCDDAVITPKSENEVKKEIEDGYIYFYQKVGTIY